MMRVLIADDEPLLATTLRRLLEGASFLAEVADSGPEALRLFLANPHDVVLCDYTLRGLSGLDFLDAVRAASPGLKRRIIFMAGGLLSVDDAQLLASRGNLVLEKPFSSSALTQAVLSVGSRQTSEGSLVTPLAAPAAVDFRSLSLV